MRPLDKFGTDDFPIHPSMIQKFILCPWRIVMLYIDGQVGDEAGPAADTGSATHRAVEALHKEGKEPAACIEVMQAERHNYPLANLEEAAMLFLRYATDPGNIGAEVVLSESPIEFNIAPSPYDTSEAPIKVIGTVDQVRRGSDGRLKMWDLKTSGRPPVEVLQDTMHQAAAYCIGASFALNEIVHPGGIIMPKQAVMHIPFTWRFTDIESILEPLRYQVAMVRNGIVMHVPLASQCKWCHAKSPDLCLPRKKRKEL